MLPLPMGDYSKYCSSPAFSYNVLGSLLLSCGGGAVTNTSNFEYYKCKIGTDINILAANSELSFSLKSTFLR